MELRRIFLSQALAAIALLLAPFAASLAEDGLPAGVRLVIGGHDPVAYFTEGKPVMGTANHAYDWDEGRYYFANAGNRDLFAGDPDRYAPRFGGYCTASLTRGVTNEADGDFWAIVDGKLYMVGTGKGKEVAANAVARLKSDPEMIALAQKNWRDKRK
jgi:YHS domain-containing protein